MVALVYKQIHESVVCIYHLLDLIHVPLLQELHFFSVAGRQHAHLPFSHLLIASAFEQDGVGVRTDLGSDRAFDDQLADKLNGFPFIHLEHVGLVKLHRLKIHLVLDHVDLQRGLLDALLKGCLECPILELVHLLEDLDLANVVKGLLPVGLVELSGSKHNEVSAILGKELKPLLIVKVNELVPEVLAYHFLLDGELVLAHVRDLKEHGCCHVDAIEGLQVDG